MRSKGQRGLGGASARGPAELAADAEGAAPAALVVGPPGSVSELVGRARGIEGWRVEDIAARLGVVLAGNGGRGGALRMKGKVGELLERALGATGGPAAEVDFPGIGVEMKTVPVDGEGRAIESTFVCKVSLAEADRAEWASSWARRKLARVLWVPVVHGPGAGEVDGAGAGEGASAARRVGAAVLWSPSAEQEAVLAADFDEILGRLGAGEIDVDARVGRWLQLRPKAANSRERTVAFGPDDERIAAPPRGLYLRARFTTALLRDPAATP